MRQFANAALPRPGNAGTVGLVLLRAYVLANNARHYDGMIAALEARGLNVVPVFASGLDARPAMERFFLRDGVPCVDAVLSLTGFSLVNLLHRSTRARREAKTKAQVAEIIFRAVTED